MILFTTFYIHIIQYLYNFLHMKQFIFTSFTYDTIQYLFLLFTTFTFHKTTFYILYNIFLQHFTYNTISLKKIRIVRVIQCVASLACVRYA